MASFLRLTFSVGRRVGLAPAKADLWVGPTGQSVTRGPNLGVLILNHIVALFLSFSLFSLGVVPGLRVRDDGSRGRELVPRITRRA